MLNEIKNQSGCPAKNDDPVGCLDGGQRPPLTDEDHVAESQCRERHHGEIEGGFQVRKGCNQRVKKIEHGPETGLDDDSQKQPDG